MKPAQIARDRALTAAAEAQSKARKAAKAAYEAGIEKHRKGSEDAQTTMGDGYIEAYKNPGTDSRRKVSGYDRAIVLKVAAHERRQRCPAFVGRDAVPR